MSIPIFLRVALAIELLLASLESTFSPLHHILPLGGSAMAQTGILICLCLVFHELKDSWNTPDDSNHHG